jgi:hypothetical protein
VQGVCKQIANDPRVRIQAHAWLDSHVFHSIATLDPDGALRTQIECCRNRCGPLNNTSAVWHAHCACSATVQPSLCGGLMDMAGTQERVPCPCTGGSALRGTCGCSESACLTGKPWKTEEIWHESGFGPLVPAKAGRFHLVRLVSGLFPHDDVMPRAVQRCQSSLSHLGCKSLALAYECSPCIGLR